MMIGNAVEVHVAQALAQTQLEDTLTALDNEYLALAA
jgi:hypothetical protein